MWSPIHEFIYRYPKKIEFCYPFNRGVVNFKLRNITISHGFLVVVKNHEFRFLVGLMALTCRLPNCILVDFCFDLDLEFSWSNMEFAISQLKIVQLPWNKKTNISIELYASNVTIIIDLSNDLELEFSRSNMEFAICRPKMVRLPHNKKQTYWF